MANVKKARTGGLGRGLDAIFIDNNASEQNAVSMLRVSEIEPRAGQPRKNFDAESLSQLADSIAANGMIQPIAVRAGENGFYQIIAGERRWRAAKMAGLSEIPVIIMDTDDRRASELALIENIQREDLNAVEEAGGYRTLIEEYGLTQEEVARRVGRSRSAITNSLRLFDLPESVLAMLEEDKLTAGHARALLGLKNPGDIGRLAELIYNKGLSVRAAEDAVRLFNRPAPPEKKADPIPEIDYKAELERKIMNSLGRRVKISDRGSGKPRMLSIEYSDNEDLETLIKRLCGDSFFAELN